MKMKGSVLIYVLLISGIMLVVVFFLTAIFASKVKFAFDFPNSVTALYAADSGIEWQIYNSAKDPDAVSPSLTNGATFSVDSAPGEPLRVSGAFRGVTRAFEILGVTTP